MQEDSHDTWHGLNLFSVDGTLFRTADTDELATLLPAYLPDGQASLVLFASYWQMQQVAEALRKKKFSLLVQGEASRQALLQLHSENCKHNRTSILFGTQSFSEGLDLPGKLLTNLVITKLLTRLVFS